MHQASEKEFKRIKEVANALGLALFHRLIRLSSTDVKIEIAACLMFLRWWWCPCFFFYFLFVF
jgi:hypothetical protein